jgi:DNA (cytosine-5)-methyltransferase 1
MNHIELFAGCGGLSLGLESVGFELLMANELSPMASETFAYNFFSQDLSSEDLDQASYNPALPGAKWLRSNYSRSDMTKRLREDPRTFPTNDKPGWCDLTGPESLKESLIVGSIVELNKWLANNRKAAAALRSGFGKGQVDLVSGGPPCQSFSMAGMREYGNARNVLPMEFAKFVGLVEPKMALLENVTGILRPFTIENEKIHAWFEVAKAFVAQGYVPLCLHVNAKFAGVAQNRPRFLMMLFRERDVFRELVAGANEHERHMLMPSKQFFKRVTNNPEIGYSPEHLPYFDVTKNDDLEFFSNSFLHPFVEYAGEKIQGKKTPYTVRDAIDDLKESGSEPSRYCDELDGLLAPHIGEHPTENREQRFNQPRTQRRFRIYQILQQIGKRSTLREVQAVLAGTSKNISDECAQDLYPHAFRGEQGEELRFGASQKKAMVAYLARHHTKKQTQKALDPEAPAPAALSIPDDACHYEDLRTLSVREMARIQSFPDNFAFRSKVTTGGQNRKFEVPQYTQVGNAVPPLLGRAIGRVFADLLSRIERIQTQTEVGTAHNAIEESV